VSQAAPLRRAHIKGDLHLSSAGWSSGGDVPEVNWPEKATTRIAKTPIVREKPYLTIENGHWFVRGVLNGQPSPADTETRRRKLSSIGLRPERSCDHAPVDWTVDLHPSHAASEIRCFRISWIPYRRKLFGT
jgi:hypothetical protein